MEHIRSKRDCVSNVTAIYFVEPTELNIGMILEVPTLNVMCEG